ncbi:MAG: hypothetical protein OEZ02_10470, partial [Anaerolineae bacterium]|nr:hypothetical protein [Anaerolineae bacterium]
MKLNFISLGLLAVVIVMVWMEIFQAKPVRLDQFSEQVRLGGGTIQDMAVNPKGDTIAVANTIGIWVYSLENLEAYHFIESRVGVSTIAWSPDGHYLVSGDYGKAIRIWDIATGNQTLEITDLTRKVSAISWSPDGENIATTSFDNILRIWDAANGQQLILSEFSDQHAFNKLFWSADSRQIAAASFEGKMLVWDVATGKQTLELNIDGKLN